MFLCVKDCHPKNDGCFMVFLSHGRCESCGKIRDCKDCHSSLPVRVKTIKKKKAKK